MIRRTEKIYKKFCKTWDKNDKEQHSIVVRQRIWWFLFIPLFIHEEIIKSNM